MELPITRPSIVSYADEINFSELLGKLKSDRYNGFIRITAGSSEGYILFKDGDQVAASFDQHSKRDALEKIKSVMDDNKTVVEVFDIKESQIDYLLNVNKPYQMTVSKAENILKEIEESKDTAEIQEESTSVESQKTDLKEEVNEPSVVKEAEYASETKLETSQIESEIKPQVEEPVSNNQVEVVEKIKEISEKSQIHETTQEPEINTVEEPVVNETKNEQISGEGSTQNDPPESLAERIEFRESQVQEEPMDRAELMKKYGLKDVEEEEVENLLETYKGGSISDEDVEKIELTLMNKIKKSILGIPKIKGTEVMVFLDNTSELFGTINIITEYESKGLLSRIIGDSKSLETLKSQIITITQIEIKKSFRGFPEIVDNFEINVEVS
ncbi:DUF2226 domain-containing protein [Methanobacterium oryzae]|uniref:DUF2226 domain-containing protein n=1 Tax=Methanobacterium oryzae TaxID=69540 RepID=UPI003D236F6A